MGEAPDTPVCYCGNEIKCGHRIDFCVGDDDCEMRDDSIGSYLSHCFYCFMDGKIIPNNIEWDTYDEVCGHPLAAYNVGYRDGIENFGAYNFKNNRKYSSLIEQYNNGYKAGREKLLNAELSKELISLKKYISELEMRPPNLGGPVYEVVKAQFDQLKLDK